MSCHCEGYSHSQGCDEYGPSTRVPYIPRPLACQWPREGEPCYAGKRCLACAEKYGWEAVAKARPRDDGEQQEYERYINGVARAASLGTMRDWSDS